MSAHQGRAVKNHCFESPLELAPPWMLLAWVCTGLSLKDAVDFPSR